MSVLNRAFESARKKNFKVVFPEDTDQRMIDAAKFLEKENLAKIIWLDRLKPSKVHDFFEIFEKAIFTFIIPESANSIPCV